MADLSRIALVDIALQTAAVTRGEFGIPLFAAPLASFAERVRVYTSADAAGEDNLPPELLTMITTCFSQTPRPKKVKVGRLSIAKAAIKASSLIATGVYSLKIGGTAITFTADGNPTYAEIATGVALAITTAAISGVTAAAVGDVVEITFASSVLAITDFSNIQWDVITPSAVAGIMATDLTAINDEDAAWYGLGLVERTEARVLDAAAWIEARDKVFAIASASADILNPSLTTDIFSQLQTLNYFRTFGIYQANAETEYPDAAWLGRCFTIQPGGETWALKRLSGVSALKLSETNYQTIIGKGGNTFEFYQTSLALTNPGKTFAGEWIDVIRGRDWLKDQIQTNMVQMMINRDKVPYTDTGIQLCASNLRSSLQTGVKVGLIAPDEFDSNGDLVPGFVITAPLSSEIDDVTKASRVLPLEFVARLAGAIHVVEISGSLAYSID